MKLLLALLFLILTPSISVAGSYSGWGHTDYRYTSKRDCCEAAMDAAVNSSMRACRKAGGLPNESFGSRRGSCDWDRRQSGRTVYYSCTTKTTVPCR
jgi:hypothetical protein